MLKSTRPNSETEEQELPRLSLRELFESQETPMLRYAFALVGRREVAEEIVQEAFLQLHRHWTEVECPQAWLVRSIRNKALNHLRDHKRELLGSASSIERAEDCNYEKAQEEVSRMEDRGILRQTLETLDETDRQLVQLKYFHGLKYRDISERTGLSISNVGYRLHHILKELAEKLRSIESDKSI